jgi:hypothetical protein
MDFLSIGIGLLSLSSGIIIKGVSYIRGCDRALGSIALQLREHVAQSQQELQAIRSELARLQKDMDGLMRYGDSDGSDH